MFQAGNVPARKNIYAPFFSDAFHHVPSPTYKRSAFEGESEESYSERMAADLDAKLTALGPGTVAAFYAEPVVGTALGVMPPPRGYFPAIKRVLDAHGVLLVMDEVMCGAGRSGRLISRQWRKVWEQGM
jgi:adenosylmethionine-8-amino-7-oxononanoate aminotransferase